MVWDYSATFSCAHVFLPIDSQPIWSILLLCCLHTPLDYHGTLLRCRFQQCRGDKYCRTARSNRGNDIQWLQGRAEEDLGIPRYRQSPLVFDCRRTEDWKVSMNGFASSSRILSFYSQDEKGFVVSSCAGLRRNGPRAIAVRCRASERNFFWRFTKTNDYVFVPPEIRLRPKKEAFVGIWPDCR